MEQEGFAPIACDQPRGSSLFLASVLLLAAALCATARADEMHLLINGKAIHLNEKPGIRYNESNWGAGFQYDMADKRSDWVPFVAVSGFLDSNRNASYYAGGGTLRRYYFNLGDTRLHADVGGIAFLMTRKGFRNDRPFFGVLPAFSLGGDKVSVNVTFIPKVDPKAVPLFFFQLKVSLDLFQSSR